MPNWLSERQNRMIEIFGYTDTGEAVHVITLTNGRLTARLLSYGGILQDLRLEGHEPSLVLGFDRFDPYLQEGGYIGATAGRFANRIANGHLDLGGTVYQLDRNFVGRHTLHGGRISTGKQLWHITGQGPDQVSFALNLPDGHMGFPGRMNIALDWWIKDEATLCFNVRAHTDKLTVCNFAHHSYFNLTGQPDMAGHSLKIAADSYLPVDDDLIPTGEVSPVNGTGFDFRTPRTLPAQRPLDTNFCLSGARQPLRPVAWLTTEQGPHLEVRTTEPGLQVYDGANLATRAIGLNGRSYGPFAGLALEPQLWPDAPHQPQFPSAALRPGQVYFQQTEFKFKK